MALDLDDEVALSNMAAGIVAGYTVMLKRAGDKLTYTSQMNDQLTQQVASLSKQVMEMTAERTSLMKQLEEFAAKVDVGIQIKGTNYVERATSIECVACAHEGRAVSACGKATQFHAFIEEVPMQKKREVIIGSPVCAEHSAERFDDWSAL